VSRLNAELLHDNPLVVELAKTDRWNGALPQTLLEGTGECRGSGCRARILPAQRNKRQGRVKLLSRSEDWVERIRNCSEKQRLVATVAAPATFGVTQSSSDLRRQQHDTIITGIMPSRISGLSSSPLDFNP
jgi:hypothetical protein